MLIALLWLLPHNPVIGNNLSSCQVCNVLIHPLRHVRAECRVPRCHHEQTLLLHNDLRILFLTVVKEISVLIHEIDFPRTIPVQRAINAVTFIFLNIVIHLNIIQENRLGDMWLYVQKEAMLGRKGFLSICCTGAEHVGENSEIGESR
jgi:hypothetical protein